MGLFVSTTGTDVVVSELGITITHPTIDRQLDEQFSAEELSRAESLTEAILNGTLTWKKELSGPVETSSDYDQDWVAVERLSSGPSSDNSLAVTSQAGSGGPSTPSDLDFLFEGSLSVLADSSFVAQTRKIGVKATKDVALEVNGSISIEVGGQVSVGPSSSISIRSL